MTHHVTPHNDSREHELETTCECLPSVEFGDNGDMLVIHDSFDGREAIEQKTGRSAGNIWQVVIK